MAAQQRIVRVRRDYNKWVANQTLEDYALRFTAEATRRWSAFRVANTALGAISFLALEAIGGAVTLTYGFTNAVAAILAVGLVIFLTCFPISVYAAKYGVDIDLLTRGAGFGYLGSTITSIIYASFTFIFFALEAAIMTKALELGLGIPESIGYIICVLAVLPIVTHGFTFISQFQMWTQPIWLTLNILPFVFIAMQDGSAFDRWMTYTGRLGPLDGAFDLRLFGAASGIIFALVAQIGEQADFLRFLPKPTPGRRWAWWAALIAAGPGWVIPGVAKLLAGSFLAYLALKWGVPPDEAADPTHMYLVAFGYVTPNSVVALGLATMFVIISQLKINITNSYAGSLAWSNFFSRLTHSHPGRVVWVVFNIVIAVSLMELGVYKAIESILSAYSHVAVAWIGAIVADLVINKPLGLSPPGIEFKRAHLFDINPVGFGATVIASALSLAAHTGVFGHIAYALSTYIALIAALLIAPAIALATRGRYYIARPANEALSVNALAVNAIAASATHICCICENSFEAQDMAHCPAYAGPICSLCCTLDARCHDLCKPEGRLSNQIARCLLTFLPPKPVMLLNSNIGRYLGLLILVVALLAGVLELVYWQALLDGKLANAPIGAVLVKAFVILILISGVICWLFILAQESRFVAQEESQRQTSLLMQEIAAHEQTDRALQQAKEAAEAANLAKSRYVVGLSHEFRTPLNAILGYAQLMEREQAPDATRHNALRTIRRSTEHLASLVDGLLDIAKIEAGRMELHRDVVNLPELLTQVSDMFRLQAEAKGVAFMHRVEGRAPKWVRVDEKRLRQALLNLLSNAVKFTDRGEVRFLVHCQRDMVEFRIEDTGPGIAASDQIRIFRPFERLESATGRWIPGTGLGLTITKLMTEVMGGSLTLASQPGEGSSFTVKLYLPEAPAPLELAHTELRRIEGYVGPRITVLLADDEETHRDLIERILQPLGFLVFSVGDGAACLALAEKFKPQLALLDINMPSMNGWETAKVLRANSANDIAIIMLSAEADDAGHNDRRDAHDDYIAKPFAIRELLDKIQIHLGLEWIYAQRPAPAIDTPILASRNKAFLEDMLALAKIGHSHGLVSVMHNQAMRHPEDREFIAHIEPLVATMQFERLVAFLTELCYGASVRDPAA